MAFKSGKDNAVSQMKRRIKQLEATIAETKISQLAEQQISVAANAYIMLLVYSTPFKDWPNGLKQAMQQNMGHTVYEWYVEQLPK